MVKWLRQATNEYAPLPVPQDLWSYHYGYSYALSEFTSPPPLPLHPVQAVCAAHHSDFVFLGEA